MSNSGNKGVFSNNIGSSVGGFTKRDSRDGGSAGGSASTAERRRVSHLESSRLARPTPQSLFLGSSRPGVLRHSRRHLPMPSYSTSDAANRRSMTTPLQNDNADIRAHHSPR